MTASAGRDLNAGEWAVLIGVATVPSGATAYRLHVRLSNALDQPRRVLKTTAGEMELQKTGDHWDITKPLRARAEMTI